MEIHTLKVNALPLPCQVGEVHAGVSCTEPTLTHTMGGLAYVSCPRHGTYVRSERKNTLRVQRTDTIQVVR